MKATRNIVLAVSLASSTALMAEPQVSEVTFSQPNQSSRRAEITYRLEGEPAIVTIDIQTNGVSIGAANLTHFSGDANRVIGTGAGHVVHWYPDLAWPDHKVDNATAVVTAWATNAPPDYMVVDLTDGSLTYYTAAESLPDGGLANDVYRTSRMVFRKIPARGVTWRMGSPTDELGRSEDETPHLVTLTEDYWMGIFEFTQGQYEAIAGERDATSFFTNTACYATRPLESWGPKMMYNTGSVTPAGGTDSVSSGTLIHTIRQKLGGMKFTLPTEAQWEYACRAGTGTALSSGKNLTVTGNDPAANELGRNNNNAGLDDNASLTASIRENDDSTGTAKVGSYPPNRWGLYDMHGNVAEYCLDEYGEYDGDMDSVQTNPTAPKTGTGTGKMVVRGGSWAWKKTSMESAYCRSAQRHSAEFTWNKVQFRMNGLRLCLAIK